MKFEILPMNSGKLLYNTLTIAELFKKLGSRKRFFIVRAAAVCLPADGMAVQQVSLKVLKLLAALCVNLPGAIALAASGMSGPFVRFER